MLRELSTQNTTCAAGGAGAPPWPMLKAVAGAGPLTHLFQPAWRAAGVGIIDWARPGPDTGTGGGPIRAFGGGGGITSGIADRYDDDLEQHSVSSGLSTLCNHVTTH